MKTEQYVVTCKLEDNQVGYRAANAFDFPPNTYNFYGVREIGKLEYYEKEAQKYAWDLARMIANSPEYTDVRRIFGVDSINDVYKLPFDSVLKICQKWDDRVKVGDVCSVQKSNGTKEKVIVISESYFDDVGTMLRVLCPDRLVRNIRPEDLTKTDKHFEVDLIFEALNKEDAE